MEYLSVEEAKAQDGLRLVLTAGVPGPWSETAKALFGHHQVSYVPVRQDGGRDNPELVAWTKHRNAPIAIYNNEPPRVRWLELLDLAERLGHGTSLYPEDRQDRMLMVGLINEIAGENGFAWNARQLMLNANYEAAGEKAYRNPMLKEYRFDPAEIDSVKEQLNSFLSFLSQYMTNQNSDYLVADQFTAADIYWAYFSNLLSPQAPEVNAMPNFLRKSYELTATLIEPFDPILLQQRDAIFEKHLVTPLVF